MPKSVIFACLLLAACADPNRVAGTDCTEPWIDVKTASIDDLAAFIALPPPPPCYQVAPHPTAYHRGPPAHSMPSF